VGGRDRVDGPARTPCAVRENAETDSTPRSGSSSFRNSPALLRALGVWIVSARSATAAPTHWRPPGRVKRRERWNCGVFRFRNSRRAPRARPLPRGRTRGRGDGLKRRARWGRRVLLSGILRRAPRARRLNRLRALGYCRADTLETAGTG